MPLPLTIDSVKHVVSSTFKITSPPITESLSDLSIKFQELPRLQRALFTHFGESVELNQNTDIYSIYLRLLIKTEDKRPGALTWIKK